MAKAIQASVVAVAMMLVALLMVYVRGANAGELRWPTIVAAGGLMVAALGLLALVPTLVREARTLVGFVPFGPDGRPVGGSPAMQQLALTLASQLVESPYQVLTSPTAVRVEWNTGDIRYRSLLINNRVQTVFRTTLVETSRPGVVRRIDELQRYNSTLGSMESTRISGRVTVVERRVDYAIDGSGLHKAVDYALDTRVVDRVVKAACAALNLKVALSADQKGGLVGVFAALVVVAMLPFGL